jgi:hypothetical protein
MVIMSMIVSGACLVPADDLLINASSVICSGTYYINDTGNDGVIIVNSSSITIDGNNSLIIGNGVDASKGIYLVNFDDVIIKNFQFQNYDNTIYMTDFNNINVHDNIITNGNGLVGSFGIGFGSSSNGIQIYNNTIYYNYDIGIASWWNVDNVNITDNNISNTDSGIQLKGTEGVNVKYNDLYNFTTSIDAYLCAIRIEHAPNVIHRSTDIHIYDNNMTGLTDCGILAKQAYGLFIENNTFEFYSLAEREDIAVNSLSEVTTSIIFSPFYKTYAGETSYRSDANWTNAHINFTVANASIKGNTFDDDEYVYLRQTGATNITHDLTNYWYRAFAWAPIYFNETELYIVDNKDKLTRRYFLPDTGWLNSDILYISYWNSYPDDDGDHRVNYTISKTEMTFTNVNNTEIHNFTIYNTTKGRSQKWELEPFDIWKYRDLDTCYWPYDDFTITSNDEGNGCDGDYYINDPGNDGVLKISTSNITFNGNGMKIIGNESGYGLYTQTTHNENVSIHSLNLESFYYGIYLRDIYNFSVYNTNTTSMNHSGIGCFGELCEYGDIYNINSSDNRYTGLFFERLNHSNVFNITIMCHLSTCSGIAYRWSFYNNLSNSYINNTVEDDRRGIQFYEIGAYNNIFNNTVYGYNSGIKLIDNVTDSNIFNNTVRNATGWGISVSEEANRNKIYDNFIYDDGWNSIHFNSDHNLIYGNYIENYIHHGIDCHNDFNWTFGINNSIYNNYITMTKTDNPGYLYADSGIFLSKCSDNKVYNNTLIDLYNSTYNYLSTKGIAVEGGNYSYNNFVHNNTLYNISGYCLYDSSNNTIWEENNLSLCDNSIRVLTLSTVGYPHIYPTFRYNLLGDLGTVLISNNYNITLTINETDNLLINLSNGATYKTIGNVRNNVEITNNTVSIINTYSELYNSTRSTPYTSITTQTIGSGERVFVFSYTSATDPKPNSIATTITDVDYSYSGNLLDWVQTGSGDVTLTNLSTLLQNIYNFVVIEKEGVVSTYTQNNEYTLDDAATYGLWGRSQLPMSLSAPAYRTILVTLLGLFLSLGVVASGIKLYQLKDHLSVPEMIRYSLILVIGTTLISTLLIMVYNI